MAKKKTLKPKKETKKKDNLKTVSKKQVKKVSKKTPASKVKKVAIKKKAQKKSPKSKIKKVVKKSFPKKASKKNIKKTTSSKTKTKTSKLKIEKVKKVANKNTNKKVSKKSSGRKISGKSNVTKIKIVGVGGCGGNIATRLYESFPRGVEVIVVNTDLQDLSFCKANKKLYIGKQTTRGLGAGMDPEIGRRSAEENREEIDQAINGADIIFITAGLGGGTGSGAAPVIAEIAKEMGILTIGIITKPFSFEGILRRQIADDAAERMRERVDTIIEISNDKIFSVIDVNTSMKKAFSAIDDILKNAVLGMAELILNSGEVNVDFADIKYIMQHSGPAIIGVGTASGKNRAIDAASNAMNSPLLEASIDGARGLLFSVSGRKDIKMNEINEVAKLVSDNLNPSAKIIFGAYYDRKVNKGHIKVTLIATGFNAPTGPSNGSLFDGFEEFESVDIIEKDEIEENITEEKKSSVENEKNDSIGKDVEDDSIWDIPAFLRKKKKNK